MCGKKTCQTVNKLSTGKTAEINKI